MACNSLRCPVIEPSQGKDPIESQLQRLSYWRSAVQVGRVMYLLLLS